MTNQRQPSQTTTTILPQPVMGAVVASYLFLFPAGCVDIGGRRFEMS